MAGNSRPSDERIALKQRELGDIYEGKSPMPPGWNSHEIFAAIITLKWVLKGGEFP